MALSFGWFVVMATAFQAALAGGAVDQGIVRFLKGSTPETVDSDRDGVVIFRTAMGVGGALFGTLALVVACVDRDATGVWLPLLLATISQVASLAAGLVRLTLTRRAGILFALGCLLWALILKGG
jgi:hypothetical protein